MRFQVFGVDARGNERKLIVDANSENEALGKSRENGLFAKKLVALPDRLDEPELPRSNSVAEIGERRFT